jgi:hypothetical protein
MAQKQQRQPSRGANPQSNPDNGRQDERQQRHEQAGQGQPRQPKAEDQRSQDDE